METIVKMWSLVRQAARGFVYYLAGIVVLSSLLVCTWLILSFPAVAAAFKVTPIGEFVPQLLRVVAFSIVYAAMTGSPVMLVFAFLLKRIRTYFRWESLLSSVLIGGLLLAAIVPVCYGIDSVLDGIQKNILPPHVPFQQTLPEKILGGFEFFFVEAPLSAYIILEGFFFKLLYLHKPGVVGTWFLVGSIASKALAIAVLAGIGSLAGYLLHFVQRVLQPRNPPRTS